MKKVFFLCIVCLLVAAGTWAASSDFEQLKEEGKEVHSAADDPAYIEVQDVRYAGEKEVIIYDRPDEAGEVLKVLLLGNKVKRSRIYENGFSAVRYEYAGMPAIEGYVRTTDLDEINKVRVFEDTVTVCEDSDVLDYPGLKNGEVIGEVLEMDVCTRTGTVNEDWSRILFQDENDEEQVGYVLTEYLDYPGKIESSMSAELDEELNTGMIHSMYESDESVFVKAEEEVGPSGTSLDPLTGVIIGQPEAVDSNSVLKKLGVFKITHYCPCSICCGPYADGITATGTIAVTNHTIAVSPAQIPYGSRVVIGNQVYVAEDCGGAIKENCIDVYVATHQEALNRGVFYADVYIIVSQ